MKQLLVRLVRAGFWLLLIGGPLLIYALNVLAMLVESTGVFAEFSDTYIAGQALDAPHATHWERLARLPYALLVVAVQVGPFILLAGGATTLLLALGSLLVRRRWPNWVLRRPVTLAGLVGRLLGLLIVAYLLGCLVHWLIPATWFSPPVVPAGFPYTIREDYWWPYAGWPLSPIATQGWTIYAPIDVSFLSFNITKASCIKLAALLTVLLFYKYRRHDRFQLKSAAAVPTA